MTVKELPEIDFSNRDQLAMEFPAHLIYAGELAVQAGEQLIFGKFNLTIPGYSILMCLQEWPQPPSMTALKDAILLSRSPSNLTQLVDDLERRELVKRIPSPSDRRVSLVEITPKGTALLNDVNALYLQTMRENLGGHTLAELQTAMKLITQFIKDSLAVLAAGKTKPTDH